MLCSASPPPQAQGELLPLPDTVLQAAVFLRPREEELRGSIDPADASSPLAVPGGPPAPGTGGCPLPAVSPGLSLSRGCCVRWGRLRGPRGDPSVRFQDPSLAGMESSTNDISHYIGLLDPWYERNVLGLMNLPMDVLCQVRVCQGQGGVCPMPREPGASLENLLLCCMDAGWRWGSWWSAGGFRPPWGGLGRCGWRCHLPHHISDPFCHRSVPSPRPSPRRTPRSSCPSWQT